MRRKNFLERKRLYGLGQDILAHSVTTVMAPAGYGKTVWVSSLIDEPDWPNTAWLSLDRHDAEPANLIYHLVRAVKRVWGGFGKDSLRTLMSLESLAREWSTAVAVFVAELSRECELVLVFDDLHLIYENRLSCTIVEYLLERLPENIHAVLIARSKLPINLYRQELDGELLQIGSGELLFTNEEARELFLLMNLKLSRLDSEFINVRAEGWAVGLRLLGNYIKQAQGSLEEALQLLQKTDSSFYRYLVKELLETMQEKERDFLLDSSLLPYLEVGLCDAAFQLDDSSALLETLQGYGLFHALENQNGTWRIHHLIGEWLQDYVVRLRSPQYIAGIRNRAALYFEKTGDINRAIEQAVLNADWDVAAAFIHKYGYDYFAQANQGDNLYQWIEQLPDHLVAADCWLLYFKGTNMMHIDDDAAFQILSSAIDIAVESGDIKCEACSLLSLLICATFGGDAKMAQEAALRFLGNPYLLKNPLSRGNALITALMIAMETDNLPEGLKVSRQALRLKLSPEQRMNVLYLSSFIVFRLGNLTRARQLIEQALAMPFVQENDRRMVLGSVILGVLLDSTGDRQSLEEVCQRLINLGSKYNMPGIAGRAYYFIARMHYREGQLMQARQSFDKAYSLLISEDIASFSSIIALHAMPLRVRSGENAGELFQEVPGLLARFEESPYGQGIDYFIYSLAGIAAMEAGELEKAGQFFERSARRWREIGARQNLAGTDLLIAYLLLLQGREKDGDKLLRSALGAAETWQWDNFWEWHDEVIYNLCRRALQKDIHPRWAAHLIKRWFPQASRRDLGGLLISADEGIRSLATELFQDISRQTDTTIIHVFYLGGYRLFINGTPVPEPQWKTQKAESLFKFLTAGQNQHSKEHVIQQLWPDSDPQSGDGKLRMTLSYVRKALAAAGLPANCLVMRRGRIYLDSKIEVYSDYQTFLCEAQTALAYAEDKHPYAIPALEQAVQMYNGEFLPEDLYQDWTASYRLNLNSLYLEVLLELARAQNEKGNPGAALQACNKYLDLEPADESVIRLAMNLLARTGKRQKALAMYKNLLATLDREYNASPELETVELCKKLRTLDRI